jgi:hypothetical protein
VFPAEEQHQQRLSVLNVILHHLGPGGSARGRPPTTAGRGSRAGGCLAVPSPPSLAFPSLVFSFTVWALCDHMSRLWVCVCVCELPVFMCRMRGAVLCTACVHVSRVGCRAVHCLCSCVACGVPCCAKSVSGSPRERTRSPRHRDSPHSHATDGDAPSSLRQVFKVGSCQGGLLFLSLYPPDWKPNRAPS